MRKPRLNTVLLYAFVLVLAASCSSGSGARKTGENDASRSGLKKKGRVRIEHILRDPAAYSGEEVAVEGTFLGWRGKCPDSASRTRSDWILSDETGCIYVTGLVPAGLDPANPSNERVLVRGFVETGTNGKPLIRAEETEPSPAGPK